MLIDELSSFKSNCSNPDPINITIQNTHPDCGHSLSQRGDSVALARAHHGALGTNDLLLGSTEPVELCLMLHAQITFTRKDSRLGIGGGRSRVRHLLPPVHVAAQRG